MSPAFCADGYTIYRDWCLEHHRMPPTRAWWDHWSPQWRKSPPARVLSEDEFDIETEQREGWTYDPS